MSTMQQEHVDGIRAQAYNVNYNSSQMQSNMNILCSVRFLKQTFIILMLASEKWLMVKIMQYWVALYLHVDQPQTHGAIWVAIIASVMSITFFIYVYLEKN
jgi:hypothetical protein